MVYKILFGILLVLMIYALLRSLISITKNHESKSTSANYLLLRVSLAFVLLLILGFGILNGDIKLRKNPIAEVSTNS